MFESYLRLWARHQIPVFPVIIYLHGGRKGLTSEEYRVQVSGVEIVRFRYEAVQLAGLDVEEYREGVGPVGAALGALMHSSKTRERAQLRASLLLQVIESGLDEARQLLLANIIKTYLTLSVEEWERYRKVVSRKEYRKVQDVDETWMDKLLRQGQEKGREEGLRVGVTERKRETLLTQMRRKFGPLPAPVTAYVQSIESAEVFDRLLEQILTAATLEEMQLDV